MNEKVEIAFEGSQEDQQLLLEAANETEGVEVVDGRNLDPFTALILVGGVLLLASVVTKWIDKLRRRDEARYGQVIDLRPGVEDPVRRDKDLEFGQIVVITPTADGKEIKVTIETYDPDNDFTTVAKSVFDTLATSAGKSIESITSAIENATGDKGSVGVEEVAAG